MIRLGPTAGHVARADKLSGSLHQSPPPSLNRCRCNCDTPRLPFS